MRDLCLFESAVLAQLKRAIPDADYGYEGAVRKAGDMVMFRTRGVPVYAKLDNCHLVDRAIARETAERQVAEAVRSSWLRWMHRASVSGTVAACVAFAVIEKDGEWLAVWGFVNGEEQEVIP